MEWAGIVVAVLGLAAGVVGAVAAVVAVLDSRRQAHRLTAAPVSLDAALPGPAEAEVPAPFGVPNGPVVEPPVAWGQWETAHLAARWVQRGLAAARNYAALAVDSGVVLHCPPLPGEPLDLGRIDATYPRGPQAVTLDGPTLRQLRSLIRDQVGDEEVRAYLLARAEVQAGEVQELSDGHVIDANQGLHRTKVGLLLVDRPEQRTETRTTLRLAPLSYWVVRTFNRRMVQLWGAHDPWPDDGELLRLRDRVLPPILRSDEVAVPLRCPSPLFVEMTLVTADGRLVVLEKSAPRSVLASIGRAWTCSLEEGVEWDDLLHHGGFDPARVAVAGAGKELGLDPEAVTDVWFSAVGLEFTHLATALLGTMVLGLTAEELRPHVDASTDFVDVRFVDLDGAAGALFPREAHPDGWDDEKRWHPTARLRALLTLYRLRGREAVRRQL